MVGLPADLPFVVALARGGSLVAMVAAISSYFSSCAGVILPRALTSCRMINAARASVTGPGFVTCASPLFPAIHPRARETINIGIGLPQVGADVFGFGLALALRGIAVPVSALG